MDDGNLIVCVYRYTQVKYQFSHSRQTKQKSSVLYYNLQYTPVNSYFLTIMITRVFA